jgi:hypothetical protein
VIDLQQKAETLITGLGESTGGSLEVSAMRLVDHHVEHDDRGRIVSTDWCLDELVAVRRRVGNTERFVTLPASSEVAAIAQALSHAPTRRDPPPMCGLDAAASAGSSIPPTNTLPLILEDLKRFGKETREQMEKVVHPGRAPGPEHAHSILVRDHVNAVRNNQGGSAHIHERFLRLRQALAADGLTWHNELCYPTAYAGDGLPIRPRLDWHHSGRFNASVDAGSDPGPVVVQGDVMVELLAVWARASRELRRDAVYSRAVSITERPSPFRTPALDDAGRTIEIRRHVTRGEVRSRHLIPQGAHRREPDAPLEPSYSALAIEPSTVPSSELLARIDQGFYASQIAALVIGEDVGRRRTLLLRLGGFNIEAGDLVGELRWIEGRVDYDRLFESVSAVGDSLYWGRWKWADGWYASPIVVFDRMHMDVET